MRSLLILALLASGPASAGCSISGGEITFGRIDPLSREPHYAVGQLRLRCDGAEGSLVRIGLGGGNAMQPGRRELRDGERVMRYELYLDPAHERPFGDDASPGGSVLELGLPGPGRLLTVPVYAVVPAGQRLQPGEYSDQIVVTVDF